MSTRSVGCEKITLQFSRVLKTLLSYDKSSRISRDVLETESFVATCAITVLLLIQDQNNMVVDIRWSNNSKIMHFHSTIIINRFSIDSTIDLPRKFHFNREGVIYSPTFIRNFPFYCFLKKIELLTLLLSVVSYLFVNFGGAYRNACTIIFAFNHILHITVSSRLQYTLTIIRWSSFRH